LKKYSHALPWHTALVWVVGLDEGNFPNNKNLLEEQRRLTRVAMTRTKNIL
jgi:superfamily I DNA/RNA helicase